MTQRKLVIPLVAVAMLPAGQLAAAWTPQTQIVIAEEAARLAPPDLFRQIDRHRPAFRKGVLAPFEEPDPLRHVKNPDGSGSLDAAIVQAVEGAIAAIQNHRPFAEVVFRLGAVSHYLADANNPLNTSQEDAREEEFYADYLHYAESAQPRFPLVFYGLRPELEGEGSVPSFVAGTLRRSRDLYPLVGAEYRRVGFLPGIEAFDDRSTAFGVAALAFNYAVNDVTLALRHIWLRAGGGDERTRLPLQGSRIYVLPRAALVP